MTKKNKTEARPKRRWLNVGPGLIIALAVAALLISQQIRNDLAARRQSTAQPIVERRIITSSPTDELGPTPDLSFILSRAEKLHLTKSQLAQLDLLQSGWQKTIGPKIDAANEAAARTNKYLTNAKDRSRTPLAQIQDAAAPVVAFSREISHARRAYWIKAASILSPAQQRLLQSEREADWAARMRSLRVKPDR